MSLEPFLAAALAAVQEPFASFDQMNDRFYWGFVLSSLVIAIGWWFFTERQRAGDRGMVAYLFPKAIWLHRSTFLDVKWYVINTVLRAAFLGFFLVSGKFWFDQTQAALTAAFGPVAAYPQPDLLHAAVAMLVIVLVLDFALWFAHLIMHRIPVLWEFHKVHHSCEVLNLFSVARTHPVETVIAVNIGAFAMASTAGALTWAWGPAATPLGFWGLNGVIGVFYLLGHHLRHSHVWLPLRGVLGILFISPAHHQIHHSEAEEHFGKNLGYIFAFWDYIAGTLAMPKRHEAIKPGLGNGEEKEYDTVWKLYALPFVKAARLFRAPPRDVPDEPAQASR